MRAWARQGVGIAVLPAFAVTPDLDSGALVALHIPLLALHLRLAWSPAGATRPATRALLYAAST
jgi:DNA-binding transcriptional LysR family regulator